MKIPRKPRRRSPSWTEASKPFSSVPEARTSNTSALWSKRPLIATWRPGSNMSWKMLGTSLGECKTSLHSLMPRIALTEPWALCWLKWKTWLLPFLAQDTMAIWFGKLLSQVSLETLPLCFTTQTTVLMKQVLIQLFFKFRWWKSLLRCSAFHHFWDSAKKTLRQQETAGVIWPVEEQLQIVKLFGQLEIVDFWAYH